MTPRRRTPVRPLGELARLYGVQTSYYNVTSRRRRRVSPDTLRAVLRALGAPADNVEDVQAALRDRRRALSQPGLDPVVVAWEGSRAAAELRLPSGSTDSRATCTLECESGEIHQWACDLSRLPARRVAQWEGTTYVARRLPLPETMPWGYHRLTCQVGKQQFCALIIRAPLHAYVPTEAGADRRWGVFLPLYSLRSNTSWGAGDFSDMGKLLEWISGLGGEVIGTLPFLAAFLDEPFDPSPYAPVSRLFWNEFYIDIARIPEVDPGAASQELVCSPTNQSALAGLRSAARVDYRRVMALKRKVLEASARRFFAGNFQQCAAYQEFIAAHPNVEDYARFRAACERQQTQWPAWPQPLRDGLLRNGDYDPVVQRYHLYAQWLAHRQLQSFSDKARRKNTALYLDLPLGAYPAGFDTWRERSIFAHGIGTGAPPDKFFRRGQMWGFPPLHPDKIREQGYRYYIACLRHQLRHAGILRVDHVMGLHRQFWVPPGCEAADGVYVGYQPEEFYAILALESRRHKTLIVGEDLGTVPRTVRPAMARHKIHGLYVAQYRLNPNHRRAMRPIGTDSVAALNTHDLPTFASFWQGRDISERAKRGELTRNAALRERKKRSRLKKALTGFLQRRGRLRKASANARAVLRAWLAQLSASPARVVMVNLEDLWLEKNQQNVPGTVTEHPNWQRKARLALEEFSRQPQVLKTLNLLNVQRNQRHTK